MCFWLHSLVSVLIWITFMPDAFSFSFFFSFFLLYHEYRYKTLCLRITKVWTMNYIKCIFNNHLTWKQLFKNKCSALCPYQLLRAWNVTAARELTSTLLSASNWKSMNVPRVSHIASSLQCLNQHVCSNNNDKWFELFNIWIQPIISIKYYRCFRQSVILKYVFSLSHILAIYFRWRSP